MVKIQVYNSSVVVIGMTPDLALELTQEVTSFMSIREVEHSLNVQINTETAEATKKAES